MSKRKNGARLSPEFQALRMRVRDAGGRFKSGEAVKDLLRELGDDLVAQVQENIRTISRPALAAATRAGKERRGSPYPSKVWMETGTLLTQGVVAKVKFGRSGKHSATVGFREDLLHPRSRKSAADIAEMLENGSQDGRLPARPVVQPAIEEMNRDSSEIGKKVNKAGFEALRKIFEGG